MADESLFEKVHDLSDLELALLLSLVAREHCLISLLTPVWNPHEVIGSGDDRDLGVMVDRVQVR